LARFFFSLRCLRPPLGGISQALADKAVLGLEFLGSIDAVVDEGEAGRLATTEGVLETEANNGILLSLVHGGELVTDVQLAHTSFTGMDNIDDLKKWGYEPLAKGAPKKL